LIVVTLVVWWSEGSSFGDALYLTLITGLTVGYGDISPLTLWGWIAGILADLVGLIVTGLYVALATNAVQRCLADNDPETMASVVAAQRQSRKDVATDPCGISGDAAIRRRAGLTS
jgi:hypothetical protein